MKKPCLLIPILLISLSLSSCQEFIIAIEYPATPVASTPITDQPAADMPAANPAVAENTATANSFPTPASPAFSVDDYLFLIQSLPQDVDFLIDNQKTLNVSFLESPGELLGIAHVHEYDSFPDDLFITQTLIQAPINITPQMMLSGHYSQHYLPTAPAHSLGSESIIYSNEAMRQISYRFARDNIMVVIDLRGEHSFVSAENAYRLAKEIHDNLPAELPMAQTIQSPPLELHTALQGNYFSDMMLVDCYEPHAETNPLIETNLGYCFQADFLDVIQNLKVGIFDKRFGKLVYLKEFYDTLTPGVQIAGLFFPVWGFSWGRLHAGEYEAFFWVQDQLVEVIPFSFLKAEGR